MSFNWQEFLSLAADIKGKSGPNYSGEATDRTAVSRAYYAAFCHVRNYARDQQSFFPTGTGKDHQLLRKHLQQQGKPKVANNLQRLRGWRNQCDYEDVISNLSALVTSALEYAHRVMNEYR